MTKAFAPHGLLSAGLQDKEGRSAKKQEEFAKETGASLVNVPNKPPPPQTGLLGAVSAHERERKREGGIGAALTERERDRRLAEERQRKLDEFQRQQLEMAQTGSMYGGPGSQFAAFNPMLANPMMMGMNPMMTGGWGFPPMNPMMGGFGATPQMFAAHQAAAQAYRQTMMAYSQAGSQAGDMGGMQNMPGMQPLNPMMTGGTMFDPRMSMMSMPMMGMNSGMGHLGVMPPQMTGMSGLDPRFSTSPSQFDLGAQPGINTPSPGHSPARHGSPAGPRPTDIPEQPLRSSANASPHP
jgi:CCR4-NOT transcriptional complex subunit CAF120